jgi:hypothetical protein
VAAPQSWNRRPRSPGRPFKYPDPRRRDIGRSRRSVPSFRHRCSRTRRASCMRACDMRSDIILRLPGDHRQGDVGDPDLGHARRRRRSEQTSTPPTSSSARPRRRTGRPPRPCPWATPAASWLYPQRSGISHLRRRGDTAREQHAWGLHSGRAAIPSACEAPVGAAASGGSASASGRQLLRGHARGERRAGPARLCVAGAAHAEVSL